MSSSLNLNVNRPAVDSARSDRSAPAAARGDAGAGSPGLVRRPTSQLGGLAPRAPLSAAGGQVQAPRSPAVALSALAARTSIEKAAARPAADEAAKAAAKARTEVLSKLSDQVFATILKDFPALAENTAARDSVHADLKAFVKEPVVGRYRYNADGSDAKLEGTPKGDLAPHIEFQKTIGSFVALRAMMAGVPIFKGDFKNPDSLESRYSSAVRDVNAQFQKASGNRLSEFEPLHSVLGTHDIMKSEEMGRLVQAKLGQREIKVGGEACTPERFAAM